MSTSEVAGVVAIILTIGVFVGTGLAFGLGWLFTASALLITLEGLIIATVLGAILAALSFKVMPFARGKVRGAFTVADSAADRVERLAETTGYKVVAPMIWLHSRAAWLREFGQAMRRG